MEPFRVGIGAGFRRPDGASTRPEFDLTAQWAGEPRVGLVMLPPGPDLPEAAFTGLDAVVLALEQVTDIFDPEPPDPGDPLLRLDSVILGPHTLAFTDQRPVGIGGSVFRALRAVLGGRAPGHVVNREVVERPGWRDKLARCYGGTGGWDPGHPPPGGAARVGRWKPWRTRAVDRARRCGQPSGPGPSPVSRERGVVAWPS